MDSALEDPPVAASREGRLSRLAELMPYAQTLLFAWRCELLAEDGARVGCFVHAWTRRRLLVARCGRVYWREEGVIVPCPRVDAHLREVLPDGRAWLTLGGYERGDLLGPPARGEELAF